MDAENIPRSVLPPIEGFTNVAQRGNRASPDRLTMMERRLAGLMADVKNPVTSYPDLCERLGVKLGWILNFLQKPDRVAKIIRAAELSMVSLLGDTYARMHHMAVTSQNPAWMKMFHERFDPAMKEKSGGTQHNTQINLYASQSKLAESIRKWSDRELEAFIEARRRSVGASGSSTDQAQAQGGSGSEATPRPENGSGPPGAGIP